MPENILAPGAVLILWTLFMLFWMFVSRMNGLKKANIDLSKTAPGGRGSDLEGLLPAKAMWKAHNLNHLMEQPTIFYPAIIILHLAGGVSMTTIYLAWAYVVLRVLHSLWQSMVNIVMIRLLLFFTGSLCLIGLALSAVKATWGLSA